MGILTTIQRFSLHDGPGIRSTVFFKGCNMRCAWCHNPETLALEPQIFYYEMKCVGCGACAMVCPHHRIVNNKMVYDRALCADCGKCAEVCFSGALEKCGKEYSVQEILDEVLQDRDYYETSGGGVTLSGGEVLLQAPFALEVLKALKDNGISTAIESNLAVDYSVIEPLLPYLDLIMCDLKIWDDEAHKKWTGVSNQKVKENIEKLGQTGIPVIVRTPLIPNVCADTDSIEKIAAFVSKLPNLKTYELLNFNPLGGSKYKALDENNPFADCKPYPDDELIKFRAAAEKYCSKVSVN